MNIINRVLLACFWALLIFSFNAQAATTFLPDYGDGKIKFPIHIDEQLCSTAVTETGEKKFHHSDTDPQCSNNQVYDEYCNFGEKGKEWITKCHCPNDWKNCVSPEIGKGKACTSDDGKIFYESCCNPACEKGGSVINCSTGIEVATTTYSNGCGDTCSICRLKSICNTSCNDDETSIPMGGTDDDTGLPCVECIIKDVCPITTCGFKEKKTEEGWTCLACTATNADCTTTSGYNCTYTKPDPEEPEICTPTTCGYREKKTEEGWTCSACTATKADCTTTSGYNCTYKEPEPDVPPCTSCWCDPAYCEPEPAPKPEPEPKPETCTPTKCDYTEKKTGEGWTCSPCTATNADCTTKAGYNCKFTACDKSFKLTVCPNHGQCTMCGGKYRLNGCDAPYTFTGSMCASGGGDGIEGQGVECLPNEVAWCKRNGYTKACDSETPKQIPCPCGWGCK